MHSHGRYTETRWSVVSLLAGEPEQAVDASTWHEAWSGLCRIYQDAMEGLVRRLLKARGGVVRVDEAEDVVQDFLLACVEKNYLIKADPRIGKFRTFLAVCLRRYTLKYCAARHAKHRLPSRPIVPFEEALDGLGAAGSGEFADDVFSKAWAACLLESAVRRVAARSQANADLLRQLLVDPTADVDALADRLGVPRRKVALRTHRAKRMLAEEFWYCVQDTTASAEQAEQECATLHPYLAPYLGLTEALQVRDR